MSLVKELKTELYGDKAHEHDAFDVYQAVTRTVVELGVAVDINGSPSDAIQLQNSVIETAREQAVGAIAYAIAYQAFMQDTTRNNNTELERLATRREHLVEQREVERHAYADRAKIAAAQEDQEGIL